MSFTKVFLASSLLGLAACGGAGSSGTSGSTGGASAIAAATPSSRMLSVELANAPATAMPSAGMGVGLVSAVGLFLAWGADGVPLAGAVAMILPLLVVPAVSAVTRAPAPELVNAAFGGEAPEKAGGGLAPGV